MCTYHDRLQVDRDNSFLNEFRVPVVHVCGKSRNILALRKRTCSVRLKCSIAGDATYTVRFTGHVESSTFEFGEVFEENGNE